MKSKLLLIVAALLMVVVTGCGGDAKADVNIFMMAANGSPVDQAAKLQDTLQSKLGKTPTVSVTLAPIFNPEKLVVEIAVGGNDIIIVPKEQFLAFGKQGGYVNLDDAADSAKYPEGVIENGKTKETHLYGIPMHKLKWLKKAGYRGDEIYAFIPANSDHVKKAKQVLKAIVNY